MFKVYLLKSLKDTTKSYVGKTIKPLQIRLREHNDGLSRFTKAYKPWELIYFETFYCDLCADKREQYFKSGVGFRLRKLLIENYKKIH